MAKTDSGSAIIQLGTTEKLIAVALAIGTIIFSVGGNYMLTSYRLTDHDTKLVNHETRITKMESIDTDRRVTKVETRQDTFEQTVSDMKTKLDVAVTILHRIDPQKQGNQ